MGWRGHYVPREGTAEGVGQSGSSGWFVSCWHWTGGGWNADAQHLYRQALAARDTPDRLCHGDQLLHHPCSPWRPGNLSVWLVGRGVGGTDAQAAGAHGAYPTVICAIFLLPTPAAAWGFRIFCDQSQTGA